MFKRFREWRKRRRVCRAARVILGLYPGNGNNRIFVLDNHGVLVVAGDLQKFLTI